jgi:long-chain acyl-CoA synthetase
MKVGYQLAEKRTEGKKIHPIWHLLYPLADQIVLRAIRDNLGLKKTYLAVSGGTAMSPEVFRFFHAIGLKLRNAYGISEVGMLTQHKGDKFDLETMGSWFRSHPAFGPPMEWKLGDNGELLIRGGAGFAGYFKNPKASAEKMADGWFRSGDAVHMREDGELVFLDRVSDLRSLSSGHFFPPQFIEIRLRFSPYIKDVIVIPDEAELTRTRKLRRNFIENRYADLIKAIYGDQKEFATEVPVKYRDGRTGVVKTQTPIIHI